MQEAIDVEVVIETPPEENPLAVAVRESGLEVESAMSLQRSFEPMFKDYKYWAGRVVDITVTDVSQVREMKLARETRLALRDTRLKVEAARKKLKEDSLRRGKAIDGMANVLKYLIEPLEEKLLASEQFAERIEEERKQKLRDSRVEELRGLGADPTFYDLANMPDDQFKQLVDGAAAAKKAREEAARKAEEERARAEKERVEKERKEKEEAERQRQENERLKKEAAEREAKHREEREAAEAEAKAKEEREARLREAIAADQKRKDDEHREAIRKAAREKRDAEDRARKAEEDRKAAEAKAKDERKRAEQAERTTKEAKEIVESAKKETAETIAKLNASMANQLSLTIPLNDKDRLDEFSNRLKLIPLPACETEHGKKLSKQIGDMVNKLTAWIEQKKATL